MPCILSDDWRHRLKYKVPSNTMLASYATAPVSVTMFGKTVRTGRTKVSCTGRAFAFSPMDCVLSQREAQTQICRERKPCEEESRSHNHSAEFGEICWWQQIPYSKDRGVKRFPNKRIALILECLVIKLKQIFIFEGIENKRYYFLFTMNILKIYNCLKLSSFLNDCQTESY